MQTISIAENDWSPPGKNCGACGHSTCGDFTIAARSGIVGLEACPFFAVKNPVPEINMLQRYSGSDVVGQKYSFVVQPLPGEPSARKIVLPFRPDLVDKWNIVKGDIVIGRPAGAGCPVQHVLRVLDADRDTGVITGHVVGPSYSRGKEVKDVKAYHMLGFEGKALPITEEPQFGKRFTFLPGLCMLDRAHTGLVNMVIKKPWGIQIRIEDIIIL
ncbi:MAG: Fe-S cluster protein [Candidatus Methanoplasma sp.]|jgi:uncharacterized Fe-S cluster-containing protein|nr:Fe-S cluster protein [Candidatus Methanoplasma sp.]